MQPLRYVVLSLYLALRLSLCQGLLNIKGVTLKIAFDSEWGVADLSSEKSERFTCSESLDMVHRLRRCSDAVLVGRSTVQADDCTLTVRRVPLDPYRSKQPTRVVIDPRLELESSKFQIFQDGLDTILVHSTAVETTATESVQTVSLAPSLSNGKISTKEICQTLKNQFGLNHIMVEGGPDTARRFLEEKMIDRAIVVRAPLCFKDPLPSNMSNNTFQDAGLIFVRSEKLGVDTIEYWSREGDWPTNPVSLWP